MKLMGISGGSVCKCFRLPPSLRANGACGSRLHLVRCLRLLLGLCHGVPHHIRGLPCGASSWFWVALVVQEHCRPRRASWRFISWPRSSATMSSSCRSSTVQSIRALDTAPVDCQHDFTCPNCFAPWPKGKVEGKGLVGGQGAKLHLRDRAQASLNEVTVDYVSG